jgi:hypothetical protein
MNEAELKTEVTAILKSSKDTPQETQVKLGKLFVRYSDEATDLNVSTLVWNSVVAEIVRDMQGPQPQKVFRTSHYE